MRCRARYTLTQANADASELMQTECTCEVTNDSTPSGVEICVFNEVGVVMECSNQWPAIPDKGNSAQVKHLIAVRIVK